MKFEQAMKNFGFKADYNPNNEEVKKVYRELATYFHPDRNPLEWWLANEALVEINDSVYIIRDVFDKNDEWDIQSYVYKNVSETIPARFMGYEGYIDLEACSATLRKVNKNLIGRIGDGGDPNVVGMEINKHLASRLGNWFIEIVRLGFGNDYPADSFEIGLDEFVSGLQEARKDPGKTYDYHDNCSVEIMEEGVNFSFVMRGRWSGDERYESEFFPILDIELFERIVYGKTAMPEKDTQKLIKV